MTQEADRDEQIARMRAATEPRARAVEEAEREETDPPNDVERPVYRRAVVSGPHRLRFPFRLAGRTVSSVSFCEPSFADIEDVTAGRISELDLHARMAGVSTDILRAFKWSDSEMASTIARLIAPQLRRK